MCYVLLHITLFIVIFLLNGISRSFGTYCLLNLSLAFPELQGEPEDIQRESTNNFCRQKILISSKSSKQLWT